MKKDCKQCGVKFEITDEDLKFYEDIAPVFNEKKYPISIPNLCPACREQRRTAFRNIRNLYLRKCDLTGKQMVSIFSPDKKYKVYVHSEWWGDKWDGKECGRDFDFNRPFFEQFDELLHEAPSINQFVINCQNCDFIHGAAHCKNCYLCFNLDYCEDSYYLTNCTYLKSCMDCLSTTNCEVCYECVNCDNCYNLLYSQRCSGCSDGYFLADCRQCRHCIGCFNLTNKEYFIFNKKSTKEEYEKMKKQLESRKYLDELMQQFVEAGVNFPKKYYYGASNENFSGNNIRNLKNSFYCFDSIDLENCKYCNYVFNSHNCMDYNIYGDHSEWIYNCLAVGSNASNNICCFGCWNGSSNCFYCTMIASCKNCFGCSGLKQAQYCIFNKQYTKEEYEKLVPKIIESMQKTGEWGEFFPMGISPFGYNETMANELYPLTKEDVLKIGAKWSDYEFGTQYHGEMVDVPDTVMNVDDSICEKILNCEVRNKPYRIIKQELDFCRRLKIPLPKKCPEQRHAERLTINNPYKLWDRTCDNTGCKERFLSVYAPERKEKVFCEKCYLKIID